MPDRTSFIVFSIFYQAEIVHQVGFGFLGDQRQRQARREKGDPVLFFVILRQKDVVIVLFFGGYSCTPLKLEAFCKCISPGVGQAQNGNQAYERWQRRNGGGTSVMGFQLLRLP